MEEEQREVIYLRGFITFKRENYQLDLLPRGNGLQKFIMIFIPNFRNRTKKSILIINIQVFINNPNIRQGVDNHPANIFHLHDPTFIHREIVYHVSIPMFNSDEMKETVFLILKINPQRSRLLFQKCLLLRNDVMVFDQTLSFTRNVIIHVTFMQDFILKLIHIYLERGFGGKNILKHFFVPSPNINLKFLHLFGHLNYHSSINSYTPQIFNETIDILVQQPHLLKSKREFYPHIHRIYHQTNVVMIRSNPR